MMRLMVLMMLLLCNNATHSIIDLQINVNDSEESKMRLDNCPTITLILVGVISFGKQLIETEMS